MKQLLSPLQLFEPVSFSFVMATGILSIILNILGWPELSKIFLLIGCLGYSWLLIRMVLRSIIYPQDVLAEMKDVGLLFTYFTFSAGTSALAVRFCLSDYNLAAVILGCLGIASTVVLLYAIFCALLFQKDISLQSVSPFWLLMSIACNYVGIVITAFWQHFLIENSVFLVLAFCSWAFGVTIYLLFMTLNLYRMFFLPFEGKDFNPSYWTCMGAAAIAVVDGSNWSTVSHPPLFLELVTPFVDGMIIMLWSWAAVWIPLLIMMEIWKYVYCKEPLHYRPSLWAIVFPLGMFTAATDLLSHSLDLAALRGLVPYFLWATVIAWLFVALLSLLSGSRKANS